MEGIYAFKEISILSQRNIFFDANILIYLFWPTGCCAKLEQEYSNAFGKLKKQGNELFVDFCVISEIINRCLRISYAPFKKSMDFKSYRNSRLGIDARRDIYVIAKDIILKQFNVIGKNFTKRDLESFCTLENTDFVDNAILSLCKDNNFVLMTNDFDFNNKGIEILTSNPKLLSIN
jgi:predicted nucleic acid-binding protein